MSNWIEPKITPDKYVKKRMAIMKQYNVVRASFERRIAVLDNLYAKKYAPKQEGDVIDIPEGSKPGYDKFTVSRPLPKIKHEKIDGNDKGVNAIVSFDYYGEFTGPEVTPVKGTLNFKDEKDEK